MPRRRRPHRLAAVLLAVALAACASPLDPRLLRLVAEPPPRWLPVPVRGVAPGQLRDTWGAARSGGRFHEGIDILAPRGTPVVSTTEGIVARLGTGGLGGRVVWITGPAGWRHYYAHLDRWAALREGAWVAAGTVLGFVGSSGNAAGGPTHLHYGIYRRDGEPINPYPLLADPAAGTPRAVGHAG